MTRRTPLLSTIITLFGLLCGACGGDASAGPGGERDGGAGAEAAPDPNGPTAPPTLQIDSERACRIDPDCIEQRHCFQRACVWECQDDGDCLGGDTCSTRRRCELGEQDGAGGTARAATPEVVPGVGILQPPWPVLRVQPGQDEVVITIETTADVPGGVIGYTVERFSHATREAQLPEQVFKAMGTRSFELRIPAGNADPQAEPSGIEEVRVATSVGTFRTRLQPRPLASGQYAGTVTVARFGSVGLPIDFEIVTDPPSASLEDADTVHLLLPVGPGSIFSPIAPDPASERDAVRTELVFQEFDQTWVATVRASFDFAAGSLLHGYAAGEVIRGLRLTLQPDGLVMGGSVRDTWEGLYDARTTDGVRSNETVVFSGTLDARRVGAARGLDALPEPAPAVVTDAPARPLPDVVGSCANTDLAVAPVMVNEVAMDCAAIASPADFPAATAAEQTRCGIAVAETALLADDTTANLIAAFLNGDTDVTGTESFAEFMARCAAGIDGACRPSEDVTCSRALTAYAIAAQPAPDANLPALFDAYTRVTREAFLGTQLAAYQADADARLEWLESQGYPAVVTAAVRDLNEELMDAWKMQVLTAHFDALAGQYDGAGLAVLARQLQGANLVDQRQLLLMEMTQSWRSAMEALTGATRRWNDIFQDLASRQREAAFASDRAFDLYVLGGVVDQLNQAAGSGFASSGLAAGFAGLLNELRRLSLPFSALVFDRDAEVVVSRSLDPLSTDDTLLSGIRDNAMGELELATTLVSGILERAQVMAVDEQLLRDDLGNQIDAHFDELVELCGFPESCSNSDREKPECWPRIAAGECGFGTQVMNLGTAEVPELTVEIVDFTGSSNISDAGEAILDVVKASEAYDGSQTTLADYAAETTRLQASIAARARELQENMAAADPKEGCDVDGVDGNATDVEPGDAGAAARCRIEQLRAQIGGAGDATKELFDNWYDDVTAERSSAYSERQTRIEHMNEVRRGDRTEDVTLQRSATTLGQTAAAVRAAADQADTLSGIAADGIPSDAATGITNALKTAIRMTNYGVTSALKAGAQAADLTANVLQAQREANDRLSADTLTELSLADELALDRREDTIAMLDAELQKEFEKGNVLEQQRRDLIDALEFELATDRELERDLARLESRRDTFFSRLVTEGEREVERIQAELTVQQRQESYLRIVQRAQLLDGRLRNLVAQRDLLNLNLGSPSVVFGWANQLAQAESRLERAKDKMMDWVVALEYLAVRPFMDARLQILLARNTFQLAEIATSLDDIQARCGGALNDNISEISLRDDVLGADFAQLDPATGETSSPAQTFRTILARGTLPVDKRVRFTSDATIGDLVARGDIWTATFDLGLSDFANLEASCNAKVQDIAIQLVGADLGDAEPTVALAYDGSSSVRSCQPDIEDIVDGIGRDATTFGAITLFKTPGRVLAPIAGINDWGGENQTLVGLPLASQYTLIIDPTLGENASINWTKLEDIRIRIHYAYQDFYPAGQCF